ncbi:D-alanine--D-alanine ligase [Aestuariibacter halophilus]|uniref:D-alanine--D-alanine ligase n=1 Tax=Fluctibacter halophilus TaxID=226011 RepID=A0ABS8G780_9ALTE|nr:D-alanine--D-alanine ligase [Aestuariibacter halophilus]MCC2616454.1 D-alanine--D-alanine ligase [Aestuariibacter halophilus]
MTQSKPVAVLYGGHSAERDVSLRSGQAVLEALQRAGVDVVGVDTASTPVHALADMNIGKALIMLHGRGGEDGTVQGALQLMGIPFTGSGVLGSALCMDKIRSKQIWQSRGLPTAAYHIASKRGFDAGSCKVIMAELGETVMVKPAQEGSSIGMAKVTSAEHLATAVQDAFNYDNQVLLEQFIAGPEYTVSILNGRALPSIRLTTPHDFYDYAAKYQVDSTEYHCPSGLSDADEQALGELALAAFEALDGRGWGRVDVMRDQQGQFYLLEANTVPGMTAKSLVPMAARQAGLSFTDLVMAILDGCEATD